MDPQESAQFNRNGLDDGDGLGNIDSYPAGNGVADDGVGLPPACREMDAGGE